MLFIKLNYINKNYKYLIIMKIEIIEPYNFIEEKIEIDEIEQNNYEYDAFTNANKIFY